MPAEGIVSAGFHRCTHVAQHHPCGASSSHTAPDQRGTTWQAHCTDQAHKDLSLFETPSDSGNGFCRRAAKSLIDLHGDQLECLSLLTGDASGSTESVNRTKSCFFFIIFFFLLSFLNIVCTCVLFVYNSLWCLKLLFIPLSEM